MDRWKVRKEAALPRPGKVLCAPMSALSIFIMQPCQLGILTDIVSLLILLFLLLFFFLFWRPLQISPTPLFQIGSRWHWQDCYSSKFASIGGVGFSVWRVILSRWRSWHRFTRKSAAAWWMHTQRLPSACSSAG